VKSKTKETKEKVKINFKKEGSKTNESY